MPNRGPLILVLLALFLIWLWGNLSGLPWGIPCLFRRFTGLSCPACGTQRALFSLLHGDPLAAWHFNYLLPFIALLLITLAVLSWRKSPLYRPLTSLPAVIIYAGILMVWLVVRNLYGIWRKCRANKREFGLHSVCEARIYFIRPWCMKNWYNLIIAWFSRSIMGWYGEHLKIYQQVKYPKLKEEVL